MQGNEPLALRDKIQQRFCLIVLDAIDIGVEYQHVVLGQRLRLQILQVVPCSASALRV